MTPRQIVLMLIVAIGLLILVVELIRRHQLREKYSLLWVMIAFGLLSIPFLYGYYARLALFLGISDPNSFFFYIAIMSLFLFSLQFSLVATSSFARQKTTTQKLALLEKRVRDLENQK